MSRVLRLGLTLALIGALPGCVGSWVQEDCPVSEDLNAVFGVSGTDVFAVGSKGTFLIRQNAKWRQLDSDTGEDLLGVWGSAVNHVVAVGTNCAAVEYNGEPEAPEDGGEPPPDLRPLTVETCLQLFAIDGIRSDRALAVGERKLHNNMLAYNGSGLVNAGDTAYCGDQVLGVSFSTESAFFTAGSNGTFCQNVGNGWQPLQISLCPVDLLGGECPTDLMHPVLWDVWVGSNGEGALVGSYGGVWPYPPPPDFDADPLRWKSIDTGYSSDLRSVHGWVSAGNQTTLYAVGDRGVVIRVQGEGVNREASGSTEDLRGVWVSPDGSHVYAVGTNGTILHYSE